MMVSRNNGDGRAFVYNNGNHNDDEDNIIIPPHHDEETEGHYDVIDETENTTTRFTGIIECDVDPELGNLHKYHEPLNEMFRHDREQKTVFAVYGLQRIEPPSTTTIRSQVSAQTTTSNTEDELLETGAANDRQSEDDDADDSEDDNGSRLIQTKKPLLLPNIITKGMYVDLDAFSQISSAPDRSRMLSDYLWKQMLVKVPQMSMWHRINGEYKLSTRTNNSKDGGPGTFFRMRKYHLKRQGPKSSVLDLFMSLSKRYSDIGNNNKKAETENERNQDRNVLKKNKTKVTSYEVLISHDPDRVREILEIISWNDESSYLQIMAEPNTKMCLSTIPTKQVQHSKASASSKDGKRNQSSTSSVSAYIKKMDKMIRYYCDDMEESFWRREPDGFHIPIITEDTPAASNGGKAIV